MRRGRIFLYLAIVLIIYLVGVLVVWQRIIIPCRQNTAVALTPTVAPVKVLAAAQSLTPGDILDDVKLSTVPWPADQIIPGMFVEASKAELIGRQLKQQVNAGMPIFSGMLINQGEQIPLEGSPWALTIPPGQVAVSIPINRLSSVSYAPRPGDHVDVIVTILFVDVDTDFQSLLPNQIGVVIASGPPDPTTGTNLPLTLQISPATRGRTEIDSVLGQAIYIIPGETQRPRMTSQMLIQDAIVLQVGDFPLKGQETQATQVAAPTPTPKGQQAPPPAEKPAVITLIVKPQEAITLNYLMHTGASLSLALRAWNDTRQFDIKAVTLQFLLENYQIPVPVRLPYTINPRIDSLAPPAPTPSQ
jgi:Flp pilus assembly protein CpaB